MRQEGVGRLCLSNTDFSSEVSSKWFQIYLPDFSFKPSTYYNVLNDLIPASYRHLCYPSREMFLYTAHATGITHAGVLGPPNVY